MLDSHYRRWRRVHALSGALPVALFLIFHFATNAVAIAGPAAFNRVAERLDQLPWVRALEIGAIGVPILFHVVLGILLANTGPGAGDTLPYPRPWLLTAQRITGAVLVVFVIFHVWGIRLSPDLLEKKQDLFEVTRGQLEHPGLFVFHALGVLAASFHLGLGLVGAVGHWSRAAAPRARLAAISWAAAILMTLVGWNALVAFVSRPARWLERDAPARAIDHRDARSSGPTAGAATLDRAPASGGTAR